MYLVTNGTCKVFQKNIISLVREMNPIPPEQFTSLLCYLFIVYKHMYCAMALLMNFLALFIFGPSARRHTHLSVMPEKNTVPLVIFCRQQLTSYHDPSYSSIRNEAEMYERLFSCLVNHYGTLLSNKNNNALSRQNKSWLP